MQPKVIIESMKIKLADQVSQSCRHLLSEINRDPASSTYGCFDRRYWAWKMVDFPEATFQRNLANLAWYSENEVNLPNRQMIKDAVIAGLRYTAHIQHRDGSFDQAYPNERSFGATGFLLPDLIKAYVNTSERCSHEDKELIESMLRRASDFLCRNNEQHGLISNHLAGAALGLRLSFDLFQEQKYKDKYEQLVAFILKNQSSEGWFPEYGGADPGYQTLCMHYLSQIYRLAPSQELKNGLQSSLDFLQFFIHPDGSFGGEYGSRRTEIYYPGGIALLADEFPLAASIDRFMRDSIEEQTTVSLVDIDMGNIAPLLSSSIQALENIYHTRPAGKLPFESERVIKEFKKAGIILVGNPCYYSILSASNGGVLKIFNKKTRRLIEDDCGALAETSNGLLISTQSTKMNRLFSFERLIYKGKSNFSVVNYQKSTPFNYLILRLLNLSVMRIRFFNEIIKKFMVSWLIRTDNRIPLVRERKIVFRGHQVSIHDQYILLGKLRLKSISHAGKFNSIHMASSRYFSGWTIDGHLQPLDHLTLIQNGRLDISRTLEFSQEYA